MLFSTDRGRRRRLALVTSGLSAHEGDWCTPALLDLVQSLARHDDVTVFSLRYPHHRQPYRVFDAQVVPFGAGQARGWPRLALWTRVALRLRRDIRAGRFDLVHALFAHEPAALAAWAIGGQGPRRIPLIVSILGGETAALPTIGYGGELQFLNRRLVRYALARADVATAGSAHVPCLDDVAPATWRCLPLGVSTERFHPRGLVTPLLGSPSLLAVASLTPVKDHATLLDAFAGLLPEFPQARLHLVGEGPLRSALQRRAAELGIAARVAFIGPMTHEQLPGLYRGADLAVVASRFESQSLVALEAAACATPLAATRVGLLPDLLPETQLTTPGDTQGLTRACRAALAAAAGQGGRAPGLAERVARDYGLAASIARWRALHGELVTA